MGRVALTRAQADYLAGLRADAQRQAAIAERAVDTWESALNAVALAVSDNGDVFYDFGAEPWVEVKPRGVTE